MINQLPADSLLPCPWCQSDDIFVYAFNDGGTRVEYVQCRNCTSCGPDHKKGRHWNDRNFRPDAAKWLRERADKQERTNAECPEHAAAYKTWRDAPIQLRMYANEVEAGR